MAQATCIPGVRADHGSECFGDPYRSIEAVADLDAALARLPDEDLLLVLFTMVPDITYSDISDMSGVCVPTLRARMRSIRSRLSEWLSG